jgi:hypothetical protein
MLSFLQCKIGYLNLANDIVVFNILHINSIISFNNTIPMWAETGCPEEVV